jgi:hypothetical protein
MCELWPEICGESIKTLALKLREIQCRVSAAARYSRRLEDRSLI